MSLMRTGLSWVARRWLTLALCSVVLAGCGDSDGAPAADAGPETPGTSDAVKLAQLEASGAIPRLERLPLIEGIDGDRNGVRDDIDAYIAKTYTVEAQRKAALQMARAYQAMLLVDKNDARALDEVSGQSFRAIACQKFAFQGENWLIESDRMMDDLRSITTNTKERLKAFLAYNKARSGSVSVRPEGNTCE